MDTLINAIVADLTLELSGTLDFSADVLKSKVKNATLEVREKRNYPQYYSDTMINDDLNRFYSTIRNIALYDYNMVGGEYQESHRENGVTRQWVKRETLFKKVIPIARTV